MIYKKISQKDLRNALWEIYYHSKLEKYLNSVTMTEIDGNDHPILEEIAKQIFEELEEGVPFQTYDG